MGLDNDYALRRVRSIRGRIEDAEELTDADQEVLVEFDEKLTRERQKNNRCGLYHHGNLLSQLYVLADVTGRLAETLQEGDEGDNALGEVLDWIHSQGYSGYTVQNKLSNLRVFADVLLDELPERIEEIEPGAWVDEDPAPMPSNIIRYVDAISMANQTDSSRDKALILTQWDGGLRPMEELYTLQRKNLEFQDDHVVITLPTQDGKTRHRDILLLAAFPQLKKWVQEDHPVHADPEEEMNPETFIWTHRNENTLLQYGSMTARFSAAGDKTVTKDHSPQHFRRSAASVLAGQPYISERDLRQRFNWSSNSDAPEHYIAAASDATQINVARARGRDVDGIDESPDTAPLPCPRCGEWTTRGLDECIWCHHNIDEDQSVFESAPMGNPTAAGEKDLAEMILDGDVTSEELRTIRKLEPQIRSNPDLFEEIDDMITKSEALEEAVNNQNGALSVSGPGSALAAISSAAGALAENWARAKHAALSIHPKYDYPLSAVGKAKLLVGWALIGAVATPLFLSSATSIGAASTAVTGGIGLSIGTVLVHRDMPSIDDSMKAARK